MFAVRAFRGLRALVVFVALVAAMPGADGSIAQQGLRSAAEDVQLTMSTQAAGATGVRYVVTFSPSAGGGLAGTDFITLVAPAGTDALAVLNALVGSAGGVQPAPPCTGDVTGDGVVTLADAVFAARAAAGL